jgi:hypothetical protein
MRETADIQASLPGFDATFTCHYTTLREREGFVTHCRTYYGGNIVSVRPNGEGFRLSFDLNFARQMEEEMNQGLRP